MLFKTAWMHTFAIKHRILYHTDYPTVNGVFWKIAFLPFCYHLDGGGGIVLELSIENWAIFSFTEYARPATLDGINLQSASIRDFASDFLPAAMQDAIISIVFDSGLHIFVSCILTATEAVFYRVLSLPLVSKTVFLQTAIGFIWYSSLNHPWFKESLNLHFCWDRKALVS